MNSKYDGRKIYLLIALVLLFCGEQTAGSINVLPPRGAYRGKNPFVIKLIFEVKDGLFVRTYQGRTRNRMEPDQVDAAFDAIQQTGQLLYV